MHNRSHAAPRHCLGPSQNCLDGFQQRIFGLMHGFESVIRQESEGFGISEETQEKVEDLLDDVEAGTQSADAQASLLRFVGSRQRIWFSLPVEVDYVLLRIEHIIHLKTHGTIFGVSVHACLGSKS